MLAYICYAVRSALQLSSILQSLIPDFRGQDIHLSDAKAAAKPMFATLQRHSQNPTVH